MGITYQDDVTESVMVMGGEELTATPNNQSSSCACCAMRHGRAKYGTLSGKMGLLIKGFRRSRIRE